MVVMNGDNHQSHKITDTILVVDKNMAKLKTTLISLQTGNTDILSYVASLLNPLKIYRNQVYVKEIQI
jgi:hypothetical protein